MRKPFIATLSALSLAGAVCLAGGLGLTRGSYESPDYEVVAERDGFEVRHYAAMAVVSTEMADDAGRRERDDRFMRLFRYIDKGNADQEKIAMTTPVFMDAGGTGSMSFVIPKEVDAGGAPKPEDDGVFLDSIDSGKFAALRFRGGSRDRDAEQAAIAKLRKSVEAAGLKIADGAAPLLAYYDPPWTPRALRRNEVLLRLAE